MGYNVLIIWSNKQSDWKTDLYNGAEVCKQTVKQVYIVNFFFYHILTYSWNCFPHLLQENCCPQMLINKTMNPRSLSSFVYPD